MSTGTRSIKRKNNELDEIELTEIDVQQTSKKTRLFLPIEVWRTITDLKTLTSGISY